MAQGTEEASLRGRGEKGEKKDSVSTLVPLRSMRPMSWPHLFWASGGSGGAVGSLWAQC